MRCLVPIIIHVWPASTPINMRPAITLHVWSIHYIQHSMNVSISGSMQRIWFSPFCQLGAMLIIDVDKCIRIMREGSIVLVQYRALLLIKKASFQTESKGFLFGSLDREESLEKTDKRAAQVLFHYLALSARSVVDLIEDVQGSREGLEASRVN